MFAKRVFFVVLIAVLALPALASLPSAGAQEGPKPDAVGLRPDAPPYALHGPYWVGTRDFVIEPDSERPLPVTVWYPALNPDSVEEAYTYNFDYISGMGNLPISGHAIEDAPPDREQGPYPLVIFSHGNYGQRFAAVYLAEHLASYGFVFIAVDHTGNTAADSGEYYSFYVLRPLDIQRVIAYTDTLTASNGALEDIIDTGHIAVTGHSFGGYTALASGGANINPAALKAWCDEYGAELDPTDDCGQFLDHLQLLAKMAGWDAVPEGLWPSLNDPRVEAVIGMAPDPSGRFFGADGLASLTVPTLLLVGSGDTQSIPAHNTLSAYPYLGSPQKALAVFEDADHMIFFFDCKAAPWAIDLGAFWACSDPVWDMDRAHDLFNHFATAFLLSVLKGDADAAAALAPDAVAFPGITYEAQGF